MQPAKDFFGKMSSSFWQWEKLRHPLAGWLRLALLFLLPFIVWSHDIVLIALWVMALISHPWWFPAYVAAGEDTPLMTQLVDVAQVWFEKTSLSERLMGLFPALVLLPAMLAAAWCQLLFWTIYFFAGMVLNQMMLLYRLLNQQE